MIIILNKKNFTIFKIENFINDEDYNILQRSFPDPSFDYLTDCNNKKFSFQSDSNIYLNLIHKNSNLKNVHQKIKRK